MKPNKFNIPAKGVCSKDICFTIKDDKLYDVAFTGGCSGNSQGIARLVQGMEISEVKKRLRGLRCGKKATSCPDQLVRALETIGVQNLKKV